MNRLDRCNTQLEKALWFAREGYSILPIHSIQNGKCSCFKDNCKSPGKHPLTRFGI